MSDATPLVVEIPSRKASIMVTSHGIIQTRPQKAKTWVIPKRGKRGKVTTFSRSSSANMKKKLITLPDYTNLYGLTLTLKSSAWNGDAEDIRYFWLKFSNSIKRVSRCGKLSPLCYYVWRIELQQNLTPHWHVLLSVESERDVLAFRKVFLDSVKRHFGYEPVDKIACDVTDITSYETAYGYMASHNTKHKRSQLGWQGRQWGLCFCTKEAKERYKAKISALEASAVAIESENDIPAMSINVGYSQLCNIEDRSYAIYKRVLKRFLFSKMRNVDKLQNPLKWSHSVYDKKRLKTERRYERLHTNEERDYNRVFYGKKTVLKRSSFGYVEKSFNCSLNWLAYRQTAQKCQFLTSQASANLVRYAL